MSFAIDLLSLDDALVALDRQVRSQISHDSWPFDEFWAPKFTNCSRTPACHPVPSTTIPTVERTLTDGGSTDDGWVCIPIADQTQFVEEQGHEVVSIPAATIENVAALKDLVRHGVSQSNRSASFDLERQVVILVPVLRWVPLVPKDEIRTIGWFFAGWVR